MSDLVPIAIYLLCLMSASACSILLLRGFAGTGARLLLWAGVCFGLLALNSLFVLFDLLIFPELDFQIWRHAASFAAVAVLLVGLVWEAD